MATRRRTLPGFLRKNSGYIFVFCALFAFVQLGLHNGRRKLIHRHTPDLAKNDKASWLDTSTFASLTDEKKKKNVVTDHPIPHLMDEAEEKYRKKLGGQSKTLKAAVSEYTRRYGRPPPKGFDEWWQFVEKYDVKMVDEYDGLVSDLAPFWELSGEEIRRRALQAGELPSIDLVRIRDGEATVINVNPNFHDSEVSARARGFRSMTGKFVHLLPDMDFPINAKAEGRVLVPWEHRKYPNMTIQDSSEGIQKMLGGPFKPDWGEDGNIWEAWRRTCDPESPARRLFSSLRTSTTLPVKNHFSSDTVSPGDDFVFATGPAKEDYCKNPHAHYEQGHFFSDWRSIPALYPVFSPARTQGFMDIKIPSHYYYGSTKRYTYGWDSVNLELKDIDSMEIPWEDKLDMIFWRGATTGGGSHPPGFMHLYQRHRFLRLASDQAEDRYRVVTFPDPPGSTASFASAAVPIGPINEEIMDVAFVKAVSAGSYPGGMQALEKDHRFADAVPLGEHWSYKYLIDMDGMSYSGRFMAFLASDSVPLKSTVYEEFFSDWIQPWVHYIPVSSSYAEIYNIHAFFSGPTQVTLDAANSTHEVLSPEERRSTDGDKRLRRIARAGKQWKRTIGRTLDMEAYVYRLCLEWARLWADDRESMNFYL